MTGTRSYSVHSLAKSMLPKYTAKQQLHICWSYLGRNKVESDHDEQQLILTMHAMWTDT